MAFHLMVCVTSTEDGIKEGDGKSLECSTVLENLLSLVLRQMRFLREKRYGEK